MGNKLYIKLGEGFLNYEPGQRIHFSSGKVLIGKSEECQDRKSVV